MNRFLLAVFILLFPVAGYILLQTGKNHFRPLPFYGPKKVLRTYHSVRGVKIPDTMYFTVPDFSLVDQDGKNFTQNTLDTNTFYIANFFYTRSGEFGKVITTRLDSLVRLFKIHPDVKFLSISLDPDFDQPPVLKSYANKIKSGREWYFLTGDKAKIFSLATNSFFLNSISGKGDSSIIFSPFLVLVDAKHRIRGYYDSTRPEELNKLRDEIIVLRLEVLRKVTDIIQH